MSSEDLSNPHTSAGLPDDGALDNAPAISDAAECASEVVESFENTTVHELQGVTAAISATFESDNSAGAMLTEDHAQIKDRRHGNMQADTTGISSPCPHIRRKVLIRHEHFPTATNPKCALCFPDSKEGDRSDENGDFSVPFRLCLHCGEVTCSSDACDHGSVHYQSTLESDPGEDDAGHCISVNLVDFSVWCHSCQIYVNDPVVDALTEKLKAFNFGEAVGTNDSNAITGETEEADNEGGISSGSDEIDSVSSDEDVQAFMGRGLSLVVGDDEKHEYPFGKPPRSLADVAKFILSDTCQSIAILAGAGMSVASGIPDFRSVGGLYETLRPGLLTATSDQREAIRVDPTFALDMTLFQQNPLPCLELNRPFILGTRDKIWKATLAHRFVELLHMKTGKLTRLYQQNIDGLEEQCTNLPRDKVVMVHGAMNEADCAVCKGKSDFKRFCSLVEKNIKDLTGHDKNSPTQSKPIPCEHCGFGTMKPAIVLFSSSLPGEFFHCLQEDLPSVDLLIVIGTSLAVAPANSLVYSCPRTAMRVVVNREPVGYRLGIDYSKASERDYFAQGDIDEVLLDLVEALGWLEDLNVLCDQLPEKSEEILKKKMETYSCYSIGK